MSARSVGRAGEWIRVTHVISGLDVGGAERVLARLVRELAPLGFVSSVLSLRTAGPVSEEIRQAGVPVLGFGLERARPRQLLRLAMAIRESRPDVVQTWLYHADLGGGLAARMVTRAPVIWNVRQGPVTPDWASPKLRSVVRACGLLSRAVPTKIVVNSESGRAFHRSIGYPDDRMVLILNGCDTARFRPDPAARALVRQELGVGNAPLVGLVGRFEPQKDHRTFLRASARIAAAVPEVQFVLAGRGTSATNPTLAALLREFEVEDRFHLLGIRSDIERITAALDVAVSSSLDEGTSNALAEALASGVPCVATDVGDNARLLDGAGMIVGVGDDAALGDVVTGLLRDATRRNSMAAAGRRHIESAYSLASMVDRYAALYEEVGGVRVRRRS